MNESSDFLKPLTGAPKRKKFLVLDIESKDGEGQKAGFTRPFMVGVYDGETYRSFRDTNPDAHWQSRYHEEGGCIDQAMRYILQKKYRGWHIYAHNGGRFDYLFQFPWLMGVGARLGYRFTAIPVASSVQILDVWKPPKPKGGKFRSPKKRTPKKKWRFLDSLRLIPMALDKAAKSFGLEGKLKHDLNLHETDRRWDSYLRQDCEQLYNVLVKFHGYVENVLLGEVGVTTPSTSIKLLRRQYMHQEYPRSVDTHEFVRRGYFGGRVEVFRAAGENLRYYDFNSSYPASMLEPMPAGEATWWGPDEPPSRLTQGQIGFVEADVFIPTDLGIPPLPVRVGALPGKVLNINPGEKLADGKLIFPVGRLRGVWEWGELQLALEMGASIINWKQSVWYEPVYLFKEYIEDLYQYRDKSRPGWDEGLGMIAKLMMNSSYGKFGQKTLRKMIHRWDDPELPEGAVPAGADPFNSPIWYAETESDASYIMPQIAARVTALSRVKLYREAINASVLAGGLPHYCDTDSVLTDALLPTSTELGALKDEFPDESGQLSGRFVAPKVYLLRGPNDFVYVRAKGVSRPTPETVERMASGWTSFSQRLEKIGSLAKLGFSRGPMMHTVPKTFRPKNGKRRMFEDGSTEPWEVDMWGPHD